MPDKKQIRWVQLRSYPKRLSVWLGEGWLPIACVSICLIAVGFAWLSPEYPRHEADIRTFGVALQVVGWIGVFRGILETRAQFNLPPVGAAIASWAKQFPLPFMKPRRVEVSATASAVGITGFAEVVVNIDQNSPLDVQIRQIIENFSILRGENRSLRKGLDQLRREVEEGFKEEERKRAADISTVRSTLVEHATGGLKLTLCGALFFLVGGVLGTLPYPLF